MPEIKILSPSMINKIAAGEVIERPANVVKELVENSIDAGATRIEVAIENNGLSLIRVVDDGCGIAAEQILLALSPHATSKIREAEDLFQIGTLGFRGEALASIAEVTQLLFRSRPENADEGTEIRSDGGQFSAPIPCGMPRGTLIEVRNLFFNIPVRRKFLKSPTTEFGHISEVMTRMALGHPEIHFLFKHNGRVIADLPPASGWEQRIRKQFGNDVADRLIHVVGNRNGLKIDGFVSHPDLSRPNNSMQYLFLNGRFIKDRSLQHALGEAYRGLLGVGRFPLAFVQMEIPPDFVDVNVHPMKLEVRFVNSGTVYSGFLGAIREEFLQSDLRSHPSASSSNESNEPFESPPFGQPTAEMKPLPRYDDPRAALDDGVATGIRDRIAAWTQGIATGSGSAPTDFPPSELPVRAPLSSNSVPPFTPFPSGDGFHSGGARTPLTLNRIGLSSGLPAVDSSVPLRRDDNIIANNPIAGSNHPPYTSPSRTIQIHQRYLVTQTEEGMAIIDQHALHERLLYERIRDKMSQGRLDSQRLLVPIPVDLTPLEVTAAIENRELLADLGLLVDPFGGNTLLINGAPAILKEIDPVATLHILLAPLMESGKKPQRESLLEEMMHQMACKGAVKAGEPISPELIDELIVQARQEQSHHCPHGRPSILIWSCQELDKMFKRV